jgi:hypothetical protein
MPCNGRLRSDPPSALSCIDLVPQLRLGGMPRLLKATPSHRPHLPPHTMHSPSSAPVPAGSLTHRIRRVTDV